MRRSLEENLSGIDDPKVLRSIERRCFWRGPIYGPVLTVALPVTLGLCLVVRILAAYVPAFADHRDILRFVAIGIGGLIAGKLISRGAQKMLPEVLRSMGRCESCGYLLAGSTAERCPECGEPIRTESNTAK